MWMLCCPLIIQNFNHPFNAVFTCFFFMNIFQIINCTFCPFNSERDAPLSRFASQPNKQYCSSVSSTDSGPASEPSVMDKSTKPCVTGDGGST